MTAPAISVTEVGRLGASAPAGGCRLPIILVKEYGRIGNRLLTFLNAAALAADCRRPLINLSFRPFAEYFAGTAGHSLACYPALPLERVWAGAIRAIGQGRIERLSYSRRWCDRLSPFLLVADAPDETEIRVESPLVGEIVRTRRTILLKAWNLHLAPLIEKQALPLRTFFDLAQPWKDRLESWLRSLPPAGVRIGVHLRRGDYSSYAGGRYYFDDSVYVRRMRELVQIFGRETAFVLASDGPIAPERFAEFRWHPAPQHPVLDLYALARCDRIIGPPSTYSAWASWHGGVKLWSMAEDRPVEPEAFAVHAYA